MNAEHEKVKAEKVTVLELADKDCSDDTAKPLLICALYRIHYGSVFSQNPLATRHISCVNQVAGQDQGANEAVSACVSCPRL